MKKLLTILLILFSFSSFAQFEAGEFVNSDTVKIDGVPLLLNTFKQGNLGGAGDIFYSTGASSQPASGSLNQVVANNLLTPNAVVKWDGAKFANSVITEVNGKVGINRLTPSFFDISTEYNGTIAATKIRLQESYLDNGLFGVQLRGYDNGIDGHDFVIEGRNSATGSFSQYFYMKNTGFFGINKTDPSERLDINGNVIADILKSRVPTGTAPLVVASTTKVDSLNAGLFDGKKASDFQLKSDTLTFDATLSDLADSAAAIRAFANTKATVSGTDNFIMKKTGASTLGNSNLIDYGSYVISSVQFNAPIFYAGSTAYSAGNVDLGFGRTGDNFAYIDFIGDQTYTDYGLRIIRGNTGANTYTQFNHRGTGDFSIKAQDAGRVILGTKNTNVLIIDTLQNVGIGAIDTTYKLNVVGAVNSTGGFSTTSKSNLNDVVGDSAVFANMKMTYGAGLNKIIYSDATGNFIWGNQSSTLLAIAGVTPSTGYLYYNGSTFSYASGGSAQWTADTYGIRYTSGKVGIGISSDSDNLLTVGDGSNNTNIAIRASSLNKRSIYATSTSNTAIEGQGGLDGVSGVGTRYGVNGASPNGNGVRGSSTNAAGVSGTSTYSFGGDFTGLGCRATQFYVSSLNTAPASSSATGTTGEIRFTSDYIYVCVATNTWKRTQISTW